MAQTQSTLRLLPEPVLIVVSSCLPFPLIVDSFRELVPVERQLALAKSFLREQLLRLLLALLSGITHSSGWRGRGRHR